MTKKEDELVEEASLLQGIDEDSSSLLAINQELVAKLKKNDALVADLSQKLGMFRKTAFGKHERHLEALSKKIEHLQETIEEKDNVIQQLRKDAQQQGKLIQELEKTLRAMRQGEKSKLADLQVLEQQLLSKSRESIHAKESIQELDATIKESIMEKGKLKKDLKVQSQKIKSYHEEIVPLKSETLRLKAENKALTTKMQVKERDIRKLFLKLKEQEKILDQRDTRYLKAIQEYKDKADERVMKSIQKNTDEVIQLKAENERLLQIIRRQKDFLVQKERLEKEFVDDTLNRFNKSFKLRLSPEELDELKTTVASQSADDEHLHAMITAALDHSSDHKEVVESLVNAGYDRKEVIQKLKKMK